MDAALNGTPVAQFDAPVYGGTVGTFTPPPTPTVPSTPPPAQPSALPVATPTTDDILGQLFSGQDTKSRQPGRPKDQGRTVQQPSPSPTNTGIVIGPLFTE
jgi:hypothetical protein